MTIWYRQEQSPAKHHYPIIIIIIITKRWLFLYLFSVPSICLRHICLYCHTYLSHPQIINGNNYNNNTLALDEQKKKYIGFSNLVGALMMKKTNGILLKQFQIITINKSTCPNYEWQRTITWKKFKTVTTLTSIHFIYKSIYIFKARHTSKQTSGPRWLH